MNSVLLDAFSIDNNFTLDIVHSGQEAKEFFNTPSVVNIIFLDTVLSDQMGIDFYKENITKLNGNIYTIIIADRYDEVEQIVAYELGVTDYLIQPLSAQILLSKARSLLKFQNMVKDKAKYYYSIRQLNFYPEYHEIFDTISMLYVRLSKIESQILWMLLENEGKFVTREYMYESIYQRDFDIEDKTIRVSISRLRKKLNKLVNENSLIKTVKGHGYMLQANIGIEKQPFIPL